MSDITFESIKVGEGFVVCKEGRSDLYLKLDPKYSELGNCVNEKGEIITFLDEDVEIYTIYAVDY